MGEPSQGQLFDRRSGDGTTPDKSIHGSGCNRHGDWGNAVCLSRDTFPETWNFIVKRYFLSILVLIFPFVANAGITYSQLALVSTTPENLEGRFSQEKYLGALDATLVSTGVFSYQRDKSIRWQTLEPIRNELVMTPTTITSKSDDGELLRLDQGSNPTAAALGKIFFSVLTAEWEVLSDYFELSGEIDGQQWHAILVPTEQTVKQVFSRIELKGEIILREIILYEKGGDRTTIRLDKQR